MRRMLAVVGLVVLVGCGTSDGDGGRAGGCGQAEAWAESMAALYVITESDDPFAGLDEAIDERDDALAELRSEAPGDVSAALGQLANLSPSPEAAEDRAVVEEHRAVVEGWMVDDCGLSPPRW